jgi:hypothetical protein
MKKVNRIGFFKNIREIREYQFGTFYFFDNLIIGEVNEGITFDWEMGKKVIDASKEIFGDDLPIAYISNRINNYQVVPTAWAKFFKNRHQLDVYCVVGNTKGSFASLVLERMFFKKTIKQFTNLEVAVEWCLLRIREIRVGKNSSVIY